MSEGPKYMVTLQVIGGPSDGQEMLMAFGDEPPVYLEVPMFSGTEDAAMGDGDLWKVAPYDPEHPRRTARYRIDVTALTATYEAPPAASKEGT